MKDKVNVYNYLGESIIKYQPQLLSPEFGYINDNGILVINWGNEDEVCDADGFLKDNSLFTEGYVITNYIIPKGERICRYGNSAGLFTTPQNSDYNNLALPYVKESIEYHEYIVSCDLKVDCYVSKGIVAPKFLSDGGAVQYKHRQSIMLECEDGYIKEDLTWIQKNI
jgi:hypothetical protein